MGRTGQMSRGGKGDVVNLQEKKTWKTWPRSKTAGNGGFLYEIMK